MFNGTKWALAALLVGLAPWPAAAHDYWLMPDKQAAAPGEVVQVRLLLGDDLQPESERPFQKDRTPSFLLVSPSGSRSLSDGSRDQQLPLAELTFDLEGTHLLALDRSAQTITLQPKQFEAYLQHEGLADIVQLRQRRRQQKSQGRERYARNLKALVQVGTTRSDDLVLQPLGTALEIVPEQNPVALRPGQVLSVRVLFEGQPLANRQIEALHREGKKLTKISKRTDREGRASFRLAAAGAWLVRLVHMRPCTSNCGNVDWESYWSSLSFPIGLQVRP